MAIDGSRADGVHHSKRQSCPVLKRTVGAASSPPCNASAGPRRREPARRSSRQGPFAARTTGHRAVRRRLGTNAVPAVVAPRISGGVAALRLPHRTASCVPMISPAETNDFDRVVENAKAEGWLAVRPWKKLEKEDGGWRLQTVLDHCRTLVDGFEKVAAAK